jgi:hypothetical protein
MPDVTYYRINNVDIAKIEETKEGCFKLTFLAEGKEVYYPTFDKAQNMAQMVSNSVCQYIKENA